MKTLKKLFSKLINLETIEEKSFWVIAPIVAVVGVFGAFTAKNYSSSFPVIVSSLLCIAIPVALMIFVYAKKNYHIAYMLLCVLVGGICVPITFVVCGGFFSGMPIFVTIISATCALCYNTKQGVIAFIFNLVGNTIAFMYVSTYGTICPLNGDTAIVNDIVSCYYIATIGGFAAIYLIISEVKNYKISRDVLQQYFDIEVRKEILRKALNGDLKLSRGDKKIAIVFADITNFTTITEKMPSEEIADFLHRFFSVADEEIHKTGGIIDKYIGDCVMAYWFEKEDENCVYNAVKSIVNIQKYLKENSEDIYNQFGTELNFSTGIAFGDVIFGDIGSDGLHEYTVIGDAVNTASRIEDKAVSGEILLSGEAAYQVKDLIDLEVLENNLYLKGKNQAIDLYRVKDLSREGKIVEIKNVNNYDCILYICGCRGSFPVSGTRFSEYGGETSCYVMKKGDYAVIVDCGTGLKNAVDILKDCKRIDILLTHVHYDHILGLLMSKLPLGAKIKFYGHFDGWTNSANTLEGFMEHPYWPVEIIHTENISIKMNEEFELENGFKAQFFKSDHPDEACVIKVTCNDKKICFFADCEDVNKLDPEIARNTDLLFFDGMYDDANIKDHIGWGHGTWQGGVRYAQELNIKKLVITHHDPEVGDHTLHDREVKARSIASNVSFAKSGDHILI